MLRGRRHARNRRPGAGDLACVSVVDDRHADAAHARLVRRAAVAAGPHPVRVTDRVMHEVWHSRLHVCANSPCQTSPKV